MLTRDKPVEFSKRPASRAFDGRPKIRSIVALLVAFTTFPSSVLASLSTTQLRAEFTATHAAIQRGHIDSDEAIDNNLRQYVLYPYLSYALLSAQINTVKQSEIDAFSKRYAGTPLPSILSRQWLRSLAEQKRWGDYLHAYGGQSDITLRCHALTAQIAAENTQGLTDAAAELWLTGHSQPKACDPAFRYLQQTGGITAQRRWKRVQLALAEGEVDLARYLSRSLPASKRQLADLWIKTHRTPQLSLAEAASWPDTSLHRDIAAYGLMSALRIDAVATYGQWGKLSDQFEWPESKHNQLARKITLLAATDYPEHGLQWLRTLPDSSQDRQIYAWRVRSALYRKDWQAVAAEINAMPDWLQKERRWQYWRARAMENGRHSTQAEPLFSALAQQADYYGFLSADRLARDYPICPLNRPSDAQVLGDILRRPEIVRAVELFHVGLLTQARREWRNGVKGLGGQRLRQAAVIASQEGWHEKAISALSAESNLRYYSLRFPVDYRQALEQAASLHDIDPALLFAIVRAESAYSVDAVSRAGARGLMQVMPGTAQQLSRDFGISYGGRATLLEPETNIKFGALRLDQLMGQFDRVLPAIAAYNAGPNAVARWLKSGPIDVPDAWIETVPYHETRDYMARVLSFAAIYDWRLTGRFQRIDQRMRASPAASNLELAAAHCPASAISG